MSTRLQLATLAPTMDPITQTVCGAIVAQAIFNKKLGRSAALFGAAGGILPDVDVFFQYSDPIVAWDMHRNFTHALAFIPIGGLIAALPFLLLPRWRRHWKLVIGAATVGCGYGPLGLVAGSYGVWSQSQFASTGSQTISTVCIMPQSSCCNRWQWWTYEPV